MNTKEKLFLSLVSSVNCCDLCTRMCDRKKVLSKMNGSINSKVVFVAEAPGRLGAESTGIPLYGDESGNNFEMLLSNIGWKREEVFITNALLCNPQDSEGNNDAPTSTEIMNCSNYLNMVLELIKPDVVVTLGSKALDALSIIKTHNYKLKDSVGKLVDWNGVKLFPLYHTSPRAAVYRSPIRQRSDFIALSHEVSPILGLKKKEVCKSVQLSKSNTILAAAVDYIVSLMNSVSFFKLTKLLYLIDYNHIKEYNTSLTNGIYLRMQEGPWLPYLKNVVKESKYIKTVRSGSALRLVSCTLDENEDLDEEDKTFIKKVVEKYKDYNDGEIKTVVYRTPPMRYVLSQEKLGKSMLKVPVLYLNETVDRMTK